MKKLTRRTFVTGSAAVLCALPGKTGAQSSWPARQIRILVPYPAGGQTDGIARAFGDYLARQLGKPTIIENKAVLATRGEWNRVRSVRIVPVLVISDASQISLQLPHVFSVEIENCVGHEASHIDFVDLDAVFETDDSAILSEKIFCR